MSQPHPLPPPPAASPRTAARVQHAGKVREAARLVGYAAFALVASLWAWVALSGLRARSFWFFLVGVTLLWTWGSVRDWRALRRLDPERAPTAEEEEAKRAAEEAAARHRRRLAARPARVTWGLLGAIVLVCLFQLAAGVRASVAIAGLVKPAVREGDLWRLITATFLHGGSWHIWMNLAALHAIGPVVEAYAPRSRLPLVYLAAALGGSLASVAASDVPSVGASGGIMGLVGYLLVLARRRPGDLPPWFARGMLVTLGLTAYIGVFGFAFIDNAAHAGGAAAGALVALATVPRPGSAPREPDARALDVLGWLSALVLAAGAAVAVMRLSAAP